MSNEQQNPWLPGATPQSGTRPEPAPATPRPGQAWADPQQWGQYPAPGPQGQQQWEAQPAPRRRKKGRAGLVVGSLVGLLVFGGLLAAGLFLALKPTDPAGATLPAAKGELTGASATARSEKFEYGVPGGSKDVTALAMTSPELKDNALGDIESVRTADASGVGIMALRAKDLQAERLDVQVDPFCTTMAEKSKADWKRITDYRAAGTTAYGCSMRKREADEQGRKGYSEVYLLPKDDKVYALVVAGQQGQEERTTEQMTSSLGTWKWR